MGIYFVEISKQVPEFWKSKFSFWPQKSNLTSEVKGRDTKSLGNQPIVLNVQFGLNLE